MPFEARLGFLNKAMLGVGNEKLIEQLTRLDSATCTSALSPVERLTVALESNSLGIRKVARLHSLHQHIVTRAVRDVTAAGSYLSGDTSSLNDRGVLKQTEKLSLLNEELSTLAKTVNQPEIKATLKPVSHVRELFAGYFQYRTIKPLLDKVNLPYSEDQLRSVRKYFTNTAEDSLDSFAPLARRYVYSKWLSGHEDNADTKISKAAVFVLTNNCSDLPEYKRDLIGSIRTFLSKVIDAEYQSMGHGIYALPQDLEMFPQNYSGTTKEIVEVYQRFGTANYCPAMLKQFAKSVVKEAPWQERMNLLGFKYYSHSRLNGFHIAGSKFLENILIWSGLRLKWSVLTVDTGEILKQVKQKMLTGSYGQINRQ